jgi:DnaJ-class molecular chaperone
MGYLTGDEAAYRPWLAANHDEGWALKILGFNSHAEPSRSDILTTFRRLIRNSHPDHGAAAEGAGQRITELTQAKRILLAEA